MGKKLYVGNMSYDMDSSSLQDLFSAHEPCRARKSSPIGKPVVARVSALLKWAAMRKQPQLSRLLMARTRRTRSDRERSQA